jgi:hypothetical protein
LTENVFQLIDLYSESGRMQDNSDVYVVRVLGDSVASLPALACFVVLAIVRAPDMSSPHYNPCCHASITLNSFRAVVLPFS